MIRKFYDMMAPESGGITLGEAAITLLAIKLLELELVEAKDKKQELVKQHRFDEAHVKRTEELAIYDKLMSLAKKTRLSMPQTTTL